MAYRTAIMTRVGTGCRAKYKVGLRFLSRCPGCIIRLIKIEISEAYPELERRAVDWIKQNLGRFNAEESEVHF